jgi:hypothetical protein
MVDSGIESQISFALAECFTSDDPKMIQRVVEQVLVICKDDDQKKIQELFFEYLDNLHWLKTAKAVLSMDLSSFSIEVSGELAGDFWKTMGREVDEIKKTSNNEILGRYEMLHYLATKEMAASKSKVMLLPIVQRAALNSGAQLTGVQNFLMMMLEQRKEERDARKENK